MQCYTELLPPTAVTHAVALPFLGPNADNLVVAKTSLLQLFDLHTATSQSSNGPASSPSRLSLIAEYSLSGTVTALSRISLQPTTRTAGAALLIATKDAKLSLIEWDPENHRISTISIHYYGGENVLTQPFGPSTGDCESFLTVDPSSRCAALKFGAKGLAILPFRQHGDELAEEGEGGEDGFDAEMGGVSPTLKRAATNQPEVDGEANVTPYKASFLLPLATLDATLTHPVHLAFLHDYREPTFGILAADVQPSSALLEQRKDCLSYMVFTLDLEQRARTNLISVPKLPSDLWKVVPLALPVGGALLVGTNELVHVDQNGKTNAVAVNEFAKVASGFSMADQSGLGMKLEGCEVETLDPRTGDLLIVLNDGSFAVLSFKLLGRNVGGMTVSRVPAEHGGLVNASAPSCLTSTHGQTLFIGSEDGDSALLRWSKDAASWSRKRSHAQMVGQDPVATATAEDEEGEEAEEVDEDDLYAPTAEAVKRTTAASSQSAVDAAATYRFEKLDGLRGLGPINNTCLGRNGKSGRDRLELVAGVGRGKSSKLAFLNREIIPQEVRSRTFEGAKNLWSIRAQSKGTPQNDEIDSHDNLLFVYDGEVTRAYRQGPSTFEGGSEEVTGTDFENEGETQHISSLASHTIIVQCRRSEIRTYDHELGLSQIIPMSDEETDAELQIVSTSFCDPYLLVLRDDSSVQVLKVDKKGEVEPLEDVPEAVAKGKWVSGCLYAGDKLSGGDAVAWLMGEEGGLQLFALPGLEKVYEAPALPFLPPVLTPDMPMRRGGRATLTEILVADLGSEEVKKPYLVVRSSMDDLTLYEPFHFDPTTGASEIKGWERLRWRKVPSTYVPKYDEGIDGPQEGRPAALRSVTVGGRSVVYIPGSSPSFLLKEPTSLPKVLGLRAKGIKAFSPLNRQSSEEGFALMEANGKMSEHVLPADASYELGWNVGTLSLGDPPEEMRHVAFHEERGVYVVATCRNIDFVLQEEDERHDQEDITLLPQIPQYTIHILSSTTHDLIQSLAMPYSEAVTSLKVMQLEVSEHTHEQKPMVVVGSAVIRGEDMPAKGAVTVFDIIDVVPEPERPESGIKLHVVSREETKGAITALESFSSGLIGTAQGMKLMIRGLKEDGSCLPVAFLDAQTCITTLKGFASSGLWLAGDAWKGLWFGGYTQEPYRLTTLAKSRARMEVMAAEFLPFDGQLFLVILDAECDMHVLQYDPENPKSTGGTRLLHRSTFHLGHFPTPGSGGIMLLPSELAPFAEQEPFANGHAEHPDGDEAEPQKPKPKPPSLFHILTASQSGALGLITPVDESTYRRLSALQTHLTSILEHAAGLNPRAYRAAESEGQGGRGVVDGSLVQRIGELGAVRRAEVLGRAGSDGWVVRSDLEILGGGGLGYL